MSIRQKQAAASAQQAQGAVREEQALELRRAGASYRDIARALGVTTSNAHKYVRRAIGRQLTRVDELSAEVRQLELDRLDRLLRGIWPQASGGNLQAIDRVLRIMERRAGILGTDAPKKYAPTGADGETLQGATAVAVLAVPATLSVEEWQALVQPAPALQ